MAPPLRASAEVESSSAVNSLAITVPGTTQVGDLIIIIAGASSSNTFATLSGYTNIANERAGSAAFRLGVWRKIAVLGDISSSVSPTISSAGTGRMICQVRVYHSVNTTTPMDATPVVASSDTQDDDVPAGGITTASANAWLVTVHGQPTNTATFITSWTDPSGAQNELISCSTDASGNQAAVVSYDYDTTTAGAYGAKTAVSTQARRWSSVMIAIRPGAVVTTGTGGLTLGASATTAVTRTSTGSGGLSIGASATTAATRITTGSAGLTIGASAVASMVSDVSVAARIGRDDGWHPATDETIASRWDETGDERGWRLGLDADGGGDDTLAGRPFFAWSTDGTAATVTVAYATDRAPIDAFDNSMIRAFLELDNGAGGWTVTFAALDDEGEWQQFGEQITGTPVTSVFESSAEIMVGAHSAGTLEPFEGRVYLVEIRNSPDGPLLASPDFTNHLAGTTSFIGNLGNVWTVSAPAAIVNSTELKTIAIVGPLASDECSTWTDWTAPRSGIGETCTDPAHECCSFYRVRSVGYVDGSLVVSDWSEPTEEFCLEWTDNEHLIRSTSADGPLYSPVKGKFEWDVDRPFTASTGVNGSRFVTSADPGGRNLHLVAAVESEAELATLRAVLTRPLVLVSPSDANEVWASPVAETVRVIKVGRIRQVTADFIGTGPEPEPQLADVT
jgi:hypothetical protein